MKADARLMASRRIDRAYGLRNGTAAAAWRAGKIAGRWSGKPNGKRLGKTLLVSTKQAAELWGGSYARTA